MHRSMLALAVLALSGPQAMPADAAQADTPPAFDVLVFTKTAGYRHRSIPAGIGALTALGHTEASYAEPDFRQHLLGGIRWAAGMTSE